jgi:hypothetical protein
MTVGELFESDKITKELVQAAEDFGGYYVTSSKFIHENWNKDVEDLSEKQFAWAHKILEDLVEKRIEGRL